MGRTRTRSQVLVSNILTRSLRTDNSVLASVGGAYSGSHVETMTDELTPGYFSKKRRGQFLPINSMNHTSYSYEYNESTYCKWKIKNQFTPYTHTGYLDVTGNAAQGYLWGKTSSSFPAWSGAVPGWTSDSVMATEALANARSKGFDVLTFMAEWHKTIDLIKNFSTRTLNRAERVAKSIKVGRKPGVDPSVEIGKAFAETWLEGRYGHRLVIYDALAVSEAITKLQDLHSKIVRGYHTSSASASRTIASDAASAVVVMKTTPVIAGTQVRGLGSVQQELTYEKRAGSLLEAVIGDVLSVDPLVTAYELIPFSFIADWIINLGSIVEAYSPFATETHLGTWISTKELLRTFAVFTPAAGNMPTSKTWTVEAGGTSSVSHLKETYNRYAVSPSPSLNFNLKLDALKVTDLVAIFIGRYTGVLRELYKRNRL